MAAFIVRLYPRAWRERYEAEMLALIEDRAMPIWEIADLLQSCAAHWIETAARAALQRVGASVNWPHIAIKVAQHATVFAMAVVAAETVNAIAAGLTVALISTKQLPPAAIRTLALRLDMAILCFFVAKLCLPALWSTSALRPGRTDGITMRALTAAKSVDHSKWPRFGRWEAGAITLLALVAGTSQRWVDVALYHQPLFDLYDFGLSPIFCSWLVASWLQNPVQRRFVEVHA